MDNTTSSNPVPIVAQEEILEQQAPLTLKAEDDELVKIVDQRTNASKEFYSKISLKERQDRNYNFLFARKDGEYSNVLKARVYNDNVLYEIEASLKPLAMSKDPDILVYPGAQGETEKKTAEELTRALQYQISTRALKEVKGIAFKHLPVYFIAAIKYFWNPAKGKNGDYEFVVVHPQNLVLDHNAKGLNVNKMDYVHEYKEVSVQELVMQFPEKEDELLENLRAEKKMPPGQLSQSQLATKIKISEVWFKYYEKKEQGWTEVSAVLWKYGDIVFKKMKNPNWDWAGETHYFKYEDEIEPQEMYSMLQQSSGEPIEGFNIQDVYYNYFEQPQFPYIFLGYDQWSTMPYDETSRIEQLVRLQENVDIRGRQKTKMLDRAMGKHVFSTEANIKAEDMEEMNWEDMDQAVLVDGDVNKTHKMIAADQPSPQMIQDYGETRQVMFQKSGVNAITGAIQSNTATSNQIAREANFTRADDLVDATINYASEEMAKAIMQMIKLRYTEEHFVRLIGAQGKTVFQRLHRDMIQDGMEVTITASGTDKIQAQNRAMDLAKLKSIDPLTLFEDLGTKNADERTRRLMAFLTDPNVYMSEFVLGAGSTPEEMGETLNGGMGGGGQQAAIDIAAIMSSQLPAVPQQVDQEYAGAIANFLQSPEFMQLPPEFQQQVLDWAAQVQATFQGVEQQTMNAPQQFGGGGSSGLPVPTNPQNPTPTDTGNVPINAPQVPDGSPRA